MLLWADGSWQIEAGIAVGSEPVWQRHGAPADLAALLSEGLGVTWTQAHDDVRALDPEPTLAAMAGHDGSLSSWIDTCLAGGRLFTVTLDSSSGAVAMLRLVGRRGVASTDGVLVAGVTDDSTANVDPRARNWTAEVDRWDLAARPWLVETAAWLNARASRDWRVAAWWLPDLAALRPRVPMLAATCVDRLNRFLDARTRVDAPTPAVYGLDEPAERGTWFLLVEWSPRSGDDDEPAGVLGFVRTESAGTVAIRCYHWSLRTPPSMPRSVRVDGDAVWPLEHRKVVERMLQDAVAAGGIPTTWELAVL